MSDKEDKPSKTGRSTFKAGRNSIDSSTRASAATRAFGNTSTLARSFGSAADIARSFGSAADIARSFGSAADIARSFGSTADIARSFGSTADIARPFGSTADIARSFGSTADIARSFGSAADIEMSMSSVADITRSMSSVAEMTSLTTSATSIAREIATRGNDLDLGGFSELVESIHLNDISISSDGAINYLGEQYSYTDIHETITPFYNQIKEALKISMARGFNVLVSLTSKITGPTKLIIFTITLNILASIIYQIYIEPFIDAKYVRHNTKTAVRRVQNNAITHEYYRLLRDNFRIVNASVLRVRANSKVKSRIIGRLPAGALTRTIQKTKKMSLIEHRDETGEVIIQGWVVTKYLKRFK